MGDAITSQLWLTSAITDEDVSKALTLCFSLKRTLSTRKIAVIASQKVSAQLRKALRHGFDIFFCLDEDEEMTKGVKPEDFVKLYPLTLKSFEKVVYLKPTMLAIKNSDEIFESVPKTANKYVWLDGESNSIFLVRPCLQTFEILTDGLGIETRHDETSVNVDKHLRNWTKNQTEISTFLDAKYNRLISWQRGLVAVETDISITEIVDVHIDDDVDTNHELGFLAKMILKQRKLIYAENVQPLLHPSGQPFLQCCNEPMMPFNEKIAIIGMSCRFPNSNNIEEFWELLLNGEDATGTAPDFRWRPETWPRRHGNSCNRMNAGFLKDSVEDFDSKFFGVSPKEMEFLDPQHRLLHVLVWEGLEDAALNPQALHGTNGGVFIGSWTNDYKDLLTLTGITDIYRKHMGNSIGAAAARISHLLGLTGPSLATESGCSSAMVAVHLACKSLQRGESEFALACGVNLLLKPLNGMELPSMVSPDGHCKTFDAKADGFARAEGCGVLVLKRMSDAVRDGDKIWGFIRGSGLTQEGVSKSMGTPTVHCESLAMELALRDAGVDPKDVSYVEAHGTGTVVGDPLEVMSIAKAYHSKERKEPLLIGSVKTNVGHTESCSGMTGIMKVVLAMQNEIIPPHRNFQTLNPAIDLEAVPARIPLQPVEWPRKEGKPRFAGVSSFGITGSDTHVIIEEPPQLPANGLVSSELERPLHIMKISAKTEDALELLFEKYKIQLTHDENKFPDIAFTANVGRADFGQRAVIIANSKEDAIKKIEQTKFMRGLVETSEEIGKVCFLFTGQGSQYPGMAKQLYETSSVFRMHFEFCAKILKNNHNIDITQVLWSSEKSSEVSRTIYSQTSIFCVEYALLKLWESWGVKPDYALGHSLGEFAAAVCAGILNVEDAIKLVAERSRLIDQLPHGKMLVINANKQRVDSLMTKFAGNAKNRLLDYAAVNSNEQIVVAGDSDLIMQFSKLCKQANVKCIVLEATHAFHSKHMDPMLDDYRAVAETTMKLKRDASCKYISGMRGTCIEAEEVDAEYWVQQTREKVLFLEASKKAVELGCKVFIEVGPQPILSALTMMNNESQQLTCLPSLKKNENEWETLLKTLAKLYMKGLGIDWKGFEKFYNRSKVRLPHYPFVGKRFWPKIQEDSGNTIHPLIGSVLSNASATKLFQSSLDLRALEWVKDHCIGANVIFPGAGFLEMCLAAGHATVESATNFLPPPNSAMKVENLIIQAPLQLHDSKVTQIQTVVELNSSHEKDSNELSVKVYRSQNSESGNEWRIHAQASFSTLYNPEIKNIPFETTNFKDIINEPCNETLAREFYSKIDSLGLKFGPVFQSLEKVWKNEASTSIIAKVKHSPGESFQIKYIFHPVVLDAMIQTIMMLEHGSGVKKLHIPIKIGQFIWISGTESHELYIQANDGTAYLVDADGKLLAVMSSVELVETTVNAIESVLEQQTAAIPDMWEEVWKTESSPLVHALDLEKTREIFYSAEFITQVEKNYNQLPVDEELTFKLLENLAFQYILQALYKCGWKPKLGQLVDESALFLELKMEVRFKRYFGFMLNLLSNEGFLQKVRDIRNISWRIVRDLPSLEEVQTTVNSPIFNSDLVRRFPSTRLLSKFGEKLAAILKGKQSALEILFPVANKGYPSLADFYIDYGEVFKQTECGNEILCQRLSNIRKAMKGQRFILKVLEIGSGTGSYTTHFLNVLEAENIEFEYTYTDISSAFFSAAEKRFEKYGNRIKFKKLNIEVDPTEQGFTPEYFDLVYMAEVIHVTKSIRETLQNIRMLMKPFAKLEMLEGIGVHRFYTFLFGSLEGFWRFQDFDLRPDHCTLSTVGWESVLRTSGFDVDGIFPIVNNHHAYISAQKRNEVAYLPLKSSKVWLVLHDPSSPISTHLTTKISEATLKQVISVTQGHHFGENCETITIRKNKEEDYVALFNSINEKGLEVEGILYCWALDKQLISQDEILQPYFYLTKALLGAQFTKAPCLRVLLNGGIVPLEDNDLSHFHTSTLWGFTKSLMNENPDMDCRCIEVGGEFQDVFNELWRDSKDSIVSLKENSRYVPKLQRLKISNNSLSLPKGTDRFQLILPNTKSMSDLQFGPLELSGLKYDEVEVQVIASAINFRDVLSVLKPSEDFKNVNTVGFDFAGRIKRVGEQVTRWKVGDRVFGCNIHFTAMPSHITLGEFLVLPLPEHLSFCEGATMPAVYMTSMLCLLEIAKINKGDIVLIHTATGGVGLSAIEICKHFGCTIIATAGSKRKQNYLRSLGIQHIFHSRNTKYGEQILELTDGKGVDVVLNSLTSEGFKEATLKACANGARFVEMSKLNIWTKEEVKAVRPDVEYTTIDLTQNSREDWIRLLKGLAELQKEKVAKPILYVRFDGLNVREALEYMQKAKHIGKIVCFMPDMKNEDGKAQLAIRLFNEESTYLITGGLGGIGFVVCQWMVEKGAKHVLLAGRRTPGPSTQTKIDQLNLNGAKIVPVKLDVGNFEECKDLIETQIAQMGFPPLKGIMHSAGTLADGLIVNQDWKKLSSTFAPKINGTLNLHELTKQLNLEHFVLFSSITALLGTPGQCNHAAGNCFEDAFTHYRRSIGLPATTINWGPWSEVGVAADIEIPGLKYISNLQGLAGLEYVLKSQRTQTGILNISSFPTLSKLFPNVAGYLDEEVWKRNRRSDAVSRKSITNSESTLFWQQLGLSSEPEEKSNVLKIHLRNILRNTLKLDEIEFIGDNVDMQEMGVDSLMFVEIRNSLQTLLGDRLKLTASSIRDCNTVSQISNKVFSLIEGKLSIETDRRPTITEANDLMREDCKLPENIRAKPRQKVRSVSQIKSVLLTGCTGSLGPYVLKQLTNLPQISKVVCLIRDVKQCSNVERLQRILSNMELLSQVDMKKVTCVSGNVAKPHLGMEAAVWEELSQSVDAVFNCAASVQHIEYYVKRDSSQSDMRAVNIRGTRNILEFACENKLKHVYHASTILAVTKIDDETGHVSEKWPEVGDFDGMTTLGYPVTKFVGDVLIKEATERGIPCKVFRFPLLGGDSKTGRCSIDSNHALLRYLFILKSGVIPSDPFAYPVLPVDTCADVSVQLFFNEEAPRDIYNIIPCKPDLDQEFVNVAKTFGCNVNIVQFSEFSQRVLESSDDKGSHSALEMFKDLYADEVSFMGLTANSPVIGVDGGDKDWRTKWWSNKLAKFAPNFFQDQKRAMEYVHQDLVFCKSQGWFDKFGLKPMNQQ